MNPYIPRFPAIRIRAVAATAVLGLLPLSGLAQADPYPTIPSSAATPSPAPILPETPANTDPGMPDRKAERFISKVSMLQSEESRLSVIAGQRATHEEVRSFAEQLRNSNQARDQELAQLAQRRSVMLPTGKDASDAAEDNQRWQSKDAQDFDEDYVQRIIRIQKNAVDTLEDYANAHDSDPELAAFAQKHLPTVRENLRQAEAIEKQVD
jgi:putative membrane protein